jgi:hypothetical protein
VGAASRSIARIIAQEHISHGEEFRPFKVRIRDAQARTHRGRVGDDLYFAVSGLRKGSAVRRLPAAAVVSRLADICSVRVRGLLVVAALSLSCHGDVLSRQILAAAIGVIWRPLRSDCSIFGSWHDQGLAARYLAADFRVLTRSSATRTRSESALRFSSLSHPGFASPDSKLNDLLACL